MAPDAASFPLSDPGPTTSEGAAVSNSPVSPPVSTRPAPFRPDMAPYRAAVSTVESGGAQGFQTIGPPTKNGGRALGAYGIMDYNVAPWSQEALGFKLTPEQFLQSPAAQKAIFDYKFGQYVDKYGPEGAAQAWFGGEGNVGKADTSDSYITTSEYVSRFNRALGGGGSYGKGGSVVSPEVRQALEAQVAAIKGQAPSKLDKALAMVDKGADGREGSGGSSMEVAAAESAPVYSDEGEELILSAQERVRLQRQRLMARRNYRKNPDPERKSKPRNGTERA